MKQLLLNLCLFLFLSGSGLAQVKQAIVPDTLPPVSKAYSQAIAVKGGRTIFIAGQVPVDRNGRLVGRGDFETQVEQVFKNLEYVLKSAGASMEDLVKINYNIVGLDSGRLALFRKAGQRHRVNVAPASTLIGVQALYDKDVWIEVEAVAVVKD